MDSTTWGITVIGGYTRVRTSGQPIRLEELSAASSRLLSIPMLPSLPGNLRGHVPALATQPARPTHAARAPCVRPRGSRSLLSSRVLVPGADRSAWRQDSLLLLLGRAGRQQLVGVDLTAAPMLRAAGRPSCSRSDLEHALRRAKALPEATSSAQQPSQRTTALRAVGPSPTLKTNNSFH